MRNPNQNNEMIFLTFNENIISNRRMVDYTTNTIKDTSIDECMGQGTCTPWETGVKVAVHGIPDVIKSPGIEVREHFDFQVGHVLIGIHNCQRVANRTCVGPVF